VGVCTSTSTSTSVPVFGYYHQDLGWLKMFGHKVGGTVRQRFPVSRIETTTDQWLQRRTKSALAPQFLLDTYIPRYQLLTAQQEARKRSEAYAHLRNCNLCPRLCGVNRFERRGTCLIGADVVVNTIAPHFGEEPCIQGRNGNGSVFFSGCNLRCVSQTYGWKGSLRHQARWNALGCP